MKKSIKNLETKVIKAIATVKGGETTGTPITTAVVPAIGAIAILR